MLTLGIETSCDETAAAVVRDGREIVSSIIASQIDMHKPYGGVVPELASREHLEKIEPIVTEALEQAGVTFADIDAIAVTQGPGLIGSLLVGVCYAKALAFGLGIPLIGVNHIEGHVFSVIFENPEIEYPAVALIVSGGHSNLFFVPEPGKYKVVSRTRDDAAGEAFDKVAKLLDLGYPGGPIIGKLAENGEKDAIPFPRAWLDAESLDFSFSGLKTAVANYVNKRRQKNMQLPVDDICATFHEAVVEVLVEKTIKAAILHRIKTVTVGGGVASNKRLRQKMQQRCDENNLKLFIPPPVFCTDNAAMIGLAGYHSFQEGMLIGPDTDVYSRSPLN